MKFGFLWKLHLTLCGQNLDARERLCPMGKAPTPAVHSLTPRGRHLGLSISGRVASKQLAAGFGGGQITAVPSLSSKFQDLAPGLPCVSSSLCQLPSRQGGHLKAATRYCPSVSLQDSSPWQISASPRAVAQQWWGSMTGSQDPKSRLC